MRFALLYFEVKELWGIGPINTFFFPWKKVLVFFCERNYGPQVSFISYMYFL